MTTLQSLLTALAAAWPVVLAMTIAAAIHGYTARRGIPTIFGFPFDLYLAIIFLVDGTYLHPHAWVVRMSVGFAGYYLVSKTAYWSRLYAELRVAESILRINRTFWRLTCILRGQEPTEESWASYETDEKSRERAILVDPPTTHESVKVPKWRRRTIFAKADAEAEREAARLMQRTDAKIETEDPAPPEGDKTDH